MGDYRATYEQSLREPDQFWRDAAAQVTWGSEPDADPRRLARAVLPMVSRRGAQHLRERPGPSRRRGQRGARCADLRQPGHRHTAVLHLRRAARRGVPVRRSAALARSGEGRPGHRLHADGARGGRRHARLRPARCGPLGRLRRLRRRGTGGTDRRRAAQGRRVRLLRHRGQSRHRVQAAARQGYRALVAQAAALRGPAAPAGRGAAAASAATFDWGDAMADAAPVGSVQVAATDPLYILYTSGTTAKPKGVVRDNGGHAVALRWSMANVYDIGPGDVWWTASDVGWVVGHSYIVYAPLIVGCHDRPLRGQAGRHSRRRCVLAGHRRPQRVGAVHRADGVPGNQEGGSRGRAPRGVRRLVLAHVVPGRGATRPGHLGVGDANGWACRSSTTGGRPRPAGRSRPTCAASSRCRQAGLAHRARARLGRARARTVRRPGGARCRGCDLHQAAAAARARCRRCGATTSGSSRPTSRRSTATT